jgi:hypothetical protein
VWKCRKWCGKAAVREDKKWKKWGKEKKGFGIRK